MAVCMSCHRKVVWNYGRYLSASTGEMAYRKEEISLSGML